MVWEGGDVLKEAGVKKKSLRSAIFANYLEPFYSIQNFLLGKPTLSKLQPFNNSSSGKILVYVAFLITCFMAGFRCFMFVLLSILLVSEHDRIIMNFNDNAFDFRLPMKCARS